MVTLGMSNLRKGILEGFHGQDLTVVVGFLGSLAVFRRWFFLTFRQSLWLASSEDWSRNSVHALLFLLQSFEDACHRDWRKVRKNNLQNMAKEPEKPTTTIRSRP